MFRKLLSLVAVFSVIILQAQQNKFLQSSLGYLKANESQMQLKAEDYQDMLVNFQTTNARGISYLFLNQTVNGLPIKNAIINFTFDKNGKIAFVGNNIVSDKNSKTEALRSAIEPETALNVAAEHLGFSGVRIPAVANRTANKVEFASNDLCDAKITGELMYDYVNGKLVPVWELTMDLKANADYWQIRINANTGEYVSKNNLTLYCNHDHGKSAHHDHCKAHTFAHVYDKAVKAEDVLSGSASYRVYALPGESPSHTNQSLVTDPHFPETSPFGWHDTNGIDGAEYTITRGNNVFAYADLDNDDDPDANVPRPDGGAALVFDFPHDKNLEPTSNTLAAQTNLFYMVNMMHDISALYGFDEEWGNFQSKNYSGKGLDGDYVLAQALDGFASNPPSLNNANFATPPDGGNGRMQMYLWQITAGSVKITSPDPLVGFINEFGTAQFGDPIPTASEAPISGEIVVAKDSDATYPTACCKSVITNVSGKIALIDRGICNFSKKVKLAEDKGAVAVIICNIPGVDGGNGEQIINMSAGSIVPNKIPSIFMKKSDCDRIRLELGKGTPVTMTLQETDNSGPDYFDGDYDNGIIAHEFAHGISTRLTGGPAISCLGNDEQMGEGWSDFFTLITTVEPSDKGTDPRGIGTYADGQSINGRGIRSYPYCTDMTVNPLTFDDLKTTVDANGAVSVHAVGTVWCTMLWDLYWAFVDKYGYDADWRNFQSGNARALTLVMEGMKIQGCNPGFIRGRNAILEADSLLYNGENGFMIWDVFARRGLGFNAQGGSEDNVTDGTENFESNPYAVALLKIQKSEVSLIQAGDVVNISLDVVNHNSNTQNGVVVTDDVPPGFNLVSGSSNVPASVVGDAVNLELGDMAFNQSKNVQYQLQASNEKSATLYKEGFEEFTEEWVVDAAEGTSLFFQTDLAAKTGIQSFFIFEEAAEIDASLTSPPFDVVGTNPALRIWHRYETEPLNDGGFIEISTDNGNVWKLIKKSDFIFNGYNSELSYTSFAIPELSGFSGTTNDQFIDSYIDLTPYKGQTVLFRFRFGCNATVVSESDLRGWFIDDVEMMDLVVYETQACVGNQNNENGTCSVTRKFIMDSDGLVNTEAEPLSFSYAIYPNPANNYAVVDVTSTQSEKIKLEVINAEGKVMHKKSFNSNGGRTFETINTSGFTSGMYFVRLSNGTSSSVSKLMVD